VNGRIIESGEPRNSAEGVALGTGSSSIYATSRLDRCFRDVHMVTQHVVGGPAGFTVAGRYFMGLGLTGM
jgi:hypothetical protein